MTYNDLRDYQQQDVDRIVENKTIANFSEQRTGKTPTTCVALEKLNAKKILIICPASMMYVWKNEYETWTTGAAIVTDSTKFDYAKYKKEDVVIITNFEKVRMGTVGETLAKLNFDAVVVDEAHRMKNRKRLTYKAIKKLKNSSIKIALTGTPAPNKPWEVWAILNWLFPIQFSSFWRFMEAYFYVPMNGFGADLDRARYTPEGAKALAEVMKTISVQHKRSEVMPWLTEVTPTCVKLPCNKSQLKAVKELQEHFEYKHIITRNIMENLVRVRQIYADPGILNLPGASPKIVWLKQYVADYPEKNIIVFSNSTKFLLRVYEELKLHVLWVRLIFGKTSAKCRADIVQEFQCKGTGKLVLIQTQCGKEGLTLDNADVTIFLDIFPPAADYQQAKDRMIAVTPEHDKPKELIHVMMKDTYDESLYRLVNANMNDTEIINDYAKVIKRYESLHGSNT